VAEGCEQGLAKAQYNLGMAYRAGAGVEKDNLQAYFWIAIAASTLEQGFVKDYRDKVEAVLTPAQLADVQERIHKWEETHPATQTASLNSLTKRPGRINNNRLKPKTTRKHKLLGPYLSKQPPVMENSRLSCFLLSKRQSQPRSDMS